MKASSSLASLSTIGDRPPSRTSLSTMSSITTSTTVGGDQSPRVITRGVSVESSHSPRAHRMDGLAKPNPSYDRSVSFVSFLPIGTWSEIVKYVLAFYGVSQETKCRSLKYCNKNTKNRF